MEPKTFSAGRNKPDLDRTYGHVQTETGDAAPHVVRSVTLFTNAFDIPNQPWQFVIRLPRHIAEFCTPSDWEKVSRLLDTPTKNGFSVVEMEITTSKFCNVTPAELQVQIATLFAENLYRVFCEKQIEAGNKAWLAPTAMQKASLGDGKR